MPIEFPATRGLNKSIESQSNVYMGVATWSRNHRRVTEM